MELELTDQGWHALRGALADAADRFARLITDRWEPGRRAVGTWSVAETAAHTAIVAHLDAGLLVDPEAATGVPEVDGLVPGTTLATLADLNAAALERFPDRSPDGIADHLLTGVATLLERSADLDPLAPATWLGRSRLTVASLLAHQLNEILLHGFDIAGPGSRAWRVPPEEAALAFDVFLMRLLGTDDQGVLFGPGVGGGRRVSVELRSDRTTPVVLTTGGGGRTTVEPPDGRADARIRFEPAAFMLTTFRRTRLTRALATGRLVVSGRRPWVAVEYLRRTRTP
ncbi:maleylpyruvate isomerase N-terminal domain-containing protein [Saccharothrix sp. Mg75]|uniref:maleylpyruvate isomerase N-terminal domain-containing protein n=1 Tax=Saccharothrix sp. Mg75 TaxID=3445357 RepID=UPI003EEFEE86